MKVFISWSGNRSEYVAKQLCDWLKNVIQTVDPWISKHIESGATWARELADELEKTDFGVACVTPENQFAPWLLFEAGAISKKTSKAFFCPYLLDMKETDLKLPLSSFQGKIADREGTFELVQSINKAQPDNVLDDKRLEETFRVWWPGLGEKLKKMPPPETSVPKHEINTA
jgi:TIR domain